MALKSAQSDTPTKLGVPQPEDNEVYNLDDEVWLKSYTSVEKSLVVDESSDDENDLIDLSGLC
jgi:hypothetical protein